MVAVVALAATVYTLGYCARFGYGRVGDPVRFVLGFPSWVFWGIVTPWVLCVLFGVWFSWSFMTDDDIGAEPEPAEGSRDEPEHEDARDG